MLCSTIYYGASFTLTKARISCKRNIIPDDDDVIIRHTDRLDQNMTLCSSFTCANSPLTQHRLTIPGKYLKYRYIYFNFIDTFQKC